LEFILIRGKYVHRAADVSLSFIGSRLALGSWLTTKLAERQLGKLHTFARVVPVLRGKVHDGHLE
jgi:hypothetical protein